MATSPTATTEWLTRRVAGAMEAAGKSRKAMERETGIPYSTLGRKLLGRSEFTFVDVLFIAEALGLPPSHFIPPAFSADRAA